MIVIVSILFGVVLGCLCKGWREKEVIKYGLPLAMGSMIILWLNLEPTKRLLNIGIYLIFLLGAFLLTYQLYGRSKPGAVRLNV